MLLSSPDQPAVPPYCLFCCLYHYLADRFPQQLCNTWLLFLITFTNLFFSVRKRYQNIKCILIPSDGSGALKKNSRSSVTNKRLLLSLSLDQHGQEEMIFEKLGRLSQNRLFLYFHLLLSRSYLILFITYSSVFCWGLFLCPKPLEIRGFSRFFMVGKKWRKKITFSLWKDFPFFFNLDMAISAFCFPLFSVDSMTLFFLKMTCFFFHHNKLVSCLYFFFFFKQN